MRITSRYTAVAMAAMMMGQTMTARTAGDDVQKIVHKVKTLYAATHTADIRFEQSGTGGTTTGTLAFASGDRYRLELARQTMVSDGSRVWTYTPDRDQVVISNVVKGTGRLTPQDILTAFPGEYATELTGERKVNGRAVWVVVCTPNGAKIGDVSRATLYIDKKTFRFQQVEIESPTLGSVKVRILSAHYGTTIPDSRFTFTPPKDARVVDLTR